MQLKRELAEVGVSRARAAAARCCCGVSDFLVKGCVCCVSLREGGEFSLTEELDHFLAPISENP